MNTINPEQKTAKDLWVEKKMLEIEAVYQYGIGAKESPRASEGYYPSLESIVIAIKFMESMTSEELKTLTEKKYDESWGRIEKIKLAFGFLQISAAEKWSDEKVIREYYDVRIKSTIDKILSIMEEVESEN